jgi:hypothetical protein
MGWVVKAKLQAFYPRENSPLPILEEGVGVGFRASMTGMETIRSLAHTEAQKPDRPPCSELLYGLGYPGSPSVKMY